MSRDGKFWDGRSRDGKFWDGREGALPPVRPVVRLRPTRGDIAAIIEQFTDLLPWLGRIEAASARGTQADLDQVLSELAALPAGTPAQRVVLDRAAQRARTAIEERAKQPEIITTRGDYPWDDQ